MTQAKIKKFWDEQAEKYKQEVRATTPADIIGRVLEIDNIVKYIKNKTKILDLGCGNGYATIEFAKRKNIQITGIDYSKEMIRQANKALSRLGKSLRKKIKFRAEDMLEINYKGEFDMVITCRALINLLSFNEQKRAIKNIFHALKGRGLYIMCENTLDGLNKLNSLRRLLGLKEIPVRWHNKYFNEELLFDFLKKHFDILSIDNFESLYCIASKVFNAKLTPEGKEPDYLAEINKIAAKLSSVGDYSPTKIFLLRKKKK